MSLLVKVLIACFICSQVYTSAFASPVVYSIGKPYGIVADTDWRCIVPGSTNPREYAALGLSGSDYVKGEAVREPISFIFFSSFDSRAKGLMDRAEKFLTHYSMVMANVFFNVHVCPEGDNYYLVRGSYIDNKTPLGSFAIYCMKSSPNYAMFVKIAADISDETILMNMFDKTFKLITPFYSPKPVK